MTMSLRMFDDEVRRIQKDIADVRVKKRDRLKNLDLFILDNSIRESTVGQLRGHTLDNKVKIYEQVKACGIKDMIVATFAHLTRVDDAFCQYLRDNGENFSHFFSFSEVSEGSKDGVYDTDTVPIALRKNQRFGIRNVIFEVDLASQNIKWGQDFTVKDMCQLILKWIKWVHGNIINDFDPRIVLNLRDLAQAMTVAPHRVLEVVHFLSNLPDDLKLFALIFEEPTGEYLPEELEAWTASLRRTMDACGWKTGKLLVHIHEKWGFQMASALDCLSAGADGVWASLCEEGAAMGHACSSVTLMNLVRLGNKKVLDKYHCTKVRTAARKITKVTTGKDPHPKQVVYGDRALDLVFDGPMGGGIFDMAEFFGVETPNRITTLASLDMIKNRLVNLFGPDPQFTLEIAGKMKEKMLEDLHQNRKEEYMSSVGISILFDRSGGKLTPAMSDAIAKVKMESIHHQSLIDQIREEWDTWDITERKKKDNCLQFDSFYHGFMAPYFGCYRCMDTQKALKAIDMDSDGLVDWNEFMVYIKWALNEYPDVKSADELLTIAFQKGIIPAMRDEKLRNKADYVAFRYSQGCVTQ